MDYCGEEKKCLHNLLLRYFGDRATLPDDCCGGACDNCMRRLGLPGAPPTRQQAAAAAKRAKGSGSGRATGFVKASTLPMGQEGGKEGRKQASSKKGRKEEKIFSFEGAGRGSATAAVPAAPPPPDVRTADRHKKLQQAAAAQQEAARRQQILIRQTSALGNRQFDGLE